MKYNDILKNKVELMGIAMILVMFFHSNIVVESSLINFIHFYSAVGVDIFLFLSGMGCLCSYRKNKNKKEFYKKRFLRILPTYLPVAIVASFLLLKVGYLNSWDFYGEITLTNFIFHIGDFPYWYWYIPSIIIFYLITPIVIDFYDKFNNKNKPILVLGFISFLLFIISLAPKIHYHCLFFGRVPIYLIGLLFGQFSFEERKMKKSTCYFWIVLMQIALIFLFKRMNIDVKWYSDSFKYLAYIFVAVGGCVLLGNFINFIKREFEWVKFIFLRFVGNLTLEIYSMHERMIIIILIFLGKLGYEIPSSNYIFIIVVAFFTIIVSWLWNKIVKWCLDNDN